MAASLLSNGNDPTSQRRDPPGNSVLRFILQFWAEFIVGFWLVARDIVLDKFRPCPKLQLEKKRTGQVCVLTGSTRGIGLEVLKKLLQLDYTVFTGARNISLMQEQVSKLRDSGVTTGQVKLLYLDLKSLRSVKTFARNVLWSPEGRRIDLLINNAGVYQGEYYEITEDNLESHFQVNYFSHFLLTNMLLPRIKTTANKKQDGYCHIINTTSCLHYSGTVDFDNLFTKKLYIPIRCYFDTKLCQVMHAKTIQAQLDSEGIQNVKFCAVHPGAIPTDVFINMGWIYPWVLRPLFDCICRTADNAASTVLHPVMDPETSKICGGQYFESGLPLQCNPLADDMHLRRKLQNLSETLCETILTSASDSFNSLQNEKDK